MKNLTFIFFGLFSLGVSWSAGANVDPIPKPCSKCSLGQKAVLDAFENAGLVDPLSLPLVFSGVCYWQGPGYNSEKAHHAVAFLDRKGESDVFYGGRFSFFTNPNPYRDWDVPKAREELPKTYDPTHKLMQTDEFAFADLNPGGETDMKYWFRQDEEGLYLIAKWGIGTVGLCALTPN